MTIHLPHNVIEEISKHKHYLLQEPPTLPWMNLKTVVGSHAVFVYPPAKETRLSSAIKIIVGVYAKCRSGESTFFEFPFGEKRSFYNPQHLDERSRKKLLQDGIKQIYHSFETPPSNFKPK